MLYPNVIAFDAHAFLTELGPGLARACVEAYNDFLAEFAAADTRRLVPLMMLPFWDVEASVREMSAAAASAIAACCLRHCSTGSGCPISLIPHGAHLVSRPGSRVADEFPHRVRSTRQGGQRTGLGQADETALAERNNRLSFVRKSAPHFASSAQAVSDVIMGGVCHRYPRLKFVSVESGFGYFPYLLENLDWLWLTSGAADEYPERDRPSAYFHRQMYATFWHERSSLPLFEDPGQPDVRDRLSA